MLEIPKTKSVVCGLVVLKTAVGALAGELRRVLGTAILASTDSSILSGTAVPKRWRSHRVDSGLLRIIHCRQIERPQPWRRLTGC